MAMNWLGTGVPMMVTMLCRLSAKPNSSAAKKAPIGFQRPKIMAARAIKPGPPEISLVKLSIATRVKNEPPMPATAPPRVTLPAGGVDLDAQGVRGLRVFADGADAEAPLGLEEPDPHHDRPRTSGSPPRTA